MAGPKRALPGRVPPLHCLLPQEERPCCCSSCLPLPSTRWPSWGACPSSSCTSSMPRCAGPRFWSATAPPLSTAIYVGSFVGVYVLSRCLRDAHIVLLGLLSVAIGMAMTAFAKTTLLMFLVRLPLLFSIMPAPVLRSMMSKIVMSSEQGALFACVAFVEMLSVGVALTVFSSTYASTVSWFSGFSFLLASGLTLIPMALIGWVLCLRLDVDGETTALTGEDDAETPGETLQLPSWDVS
ncbi:hypothetical protein SKAU_G00272240 [Synaphobranchus kaupii]|uniref:Solute carrier family 46 member 3 n=1 Tax=Synaphobranchus kaupii TaxID=118154 RepID=A0A9Q1F0Q5_SYNKA|nr:hypothetical protein SKAU_G00272240 [Synaphobranchus kaupii]